MINITNRQVDLEALVRQARMERSMAIGNAIASLVAAVSRGTSWIIAKLSRAPRVTHATQRP